MILDEYRSRAVQVDEGKEFMSLIQKDISGGRSDKNEIDKIRMRPTATSLSISGLDQDAFEYFIQEYGSQFKSIYLWKCPKIKSLRKFESLKTIEAISIYWNQHSEDLWDMSKNNQLKYIAIEDFTRLQDLSPLSSAVELKALEFGNKIWDKAIFKSLKPIGACHSLSELRFSAKEILDENIEPLSELRQLEYIDFPLRMFPTEKVAWLKANLPQNIKSRCLNAYWRIDKPIVENGRSKDTFIIGKRKPFLSWDADQEKIVRYAEQFELLVASYRKDI